MSFSHSVLLDKNTIDPEYYLVLLGRKNVIGANESLNIADSLELQNSQYSKKHESKDKYSLIYSKVFVLTMCSLPPPESS